MMIPVLIGWIIGVPLDIWWPRKVAPEHQGLARAYSAIRVTSILLALSFVLYFVVVIRMGSLGPIGWLEGLAMGMGGTAFMLSPLATCATALDAQRRWMAVCGAYGAALLVAGQVWFSFSMLLAFLQHAFPAPFWFSAFMAVSAALAAVALVLVLELYTMVRRPTA